MNTPCDRFFLVLIFFVFWKILNFLDFFGSPGWQEGDPTDETEDESVFVALCCSFVFISYDEVFSCKKFFSSFGSCLHGEYSRNSTSGATQKVICASWGEVSTNLRLVLVCATLPRLLETVPCLTAVVCAWNNDGYRRFNRVSRASTKRIKYYPHSWGYSRWHFW